MDLGSSSKIRRGSWKNWRYAYSKRRAITKQRKIASSLKKTEERRSNSSPTESSNGRDG